MNVVYKMLEDGGFVAGDRDSEMTSYAYPTSPHALVARKDPELAAKDMLRGENILYRSIPAIKEYDRKNWLLLAGASEQMPPSEPAEKR